MLTYRLLVAHLAATMLVIVATGLLLRGRVAFCWSFFGYVLATVAFNRVMVYWPDRFWVLSFFSMKETALVVLKIIIALEIWHRSFSSFPRARVHVGLLLAGALLVTATGALVISPRLDPYAALLGVINPRLQAGTLALYAIVVSAASWYRVPLHPLHRAILVGFAAYLTVYACVSSLLGLNSEGRWLLVLRRIDTTAYVATAVWWAWAAWRPLRAPSPVVSRLHPWAHSW